jgi:hypothetical protein
MESKPQTEAPAAHAKVGQNLGVVRRHDIRNSLDFNDQLPTYENVRAKPFIELDVLQVTGIPACRSKAFPARSSSWRRQPS